MVALECLASIFTVIGFSLISISWLLSGFWISLIGNIIWSIWGIQKKAYFLILVQFFLALASINGLAGL